MTCNETRTQLDAYLDGDLQPAASRAFEDHIEDCGACRDTVDRARRLLRALARLPVAEPGGGLEEFANRALAAAAGARRRRSRSAKLIAGGFVAAFAASILTVIYTGLLVEAPKTELAAGLPTVSMSIDEPRVVNLVFTSNSALADVSLLIDLPEGVEIAGYEGRREVRWKTQLDMGKNVLPLELVAHAEARGQLVARLQHGERQKVFRVYLSVMPG